MVSNKLTKPFRKVRRFVKRKSKKINFMKILAIILLIAMISTTILPYIL